ncbi:MAG: hypothetical protein LBU83_08525 [Bacteroidales bacterium]|jgi:hypothetical protein|nr:hypothetical protein [Bacteroidales bacterium]
MMKKSLIFCILIGVTFCSFAQIIKHYSVNIATNTRNTHYYDFELSLCENSNYRMSLISHSSGIFDAIIFHYYISAGNYEVKNDTLILTDSYMHHQMIYKFDKPYVYPVQVFPFMMNKVFIDYGKTSFEKCDDMFKVISIEEEINNFRKENIQEFPLEKGLYKFHYEFYDRCEIEFFEDEKFEIRFNFDLGDYKNSEKSINSIVLPLYIGTWERDGNILILWDTNFEHQFYGLIRKEGIELLVLPFSELPIFTRE